MVWPAVLQQAASLECRREHGLWFGVLAGHGLEKCFVVLVI